MVARLIFALLSLLATVAIGVVAVALASSNDPAPRASDIDFCPSTEQIEAHLDETGEDYKPQLPDGQGCGYDGRVYTVDEDDLRADPAELTEAERCELTKAAFLDSQPVPSGDPSVLKGVNDDGGEVGVMLDASPEYLERRGANDIHDWARGMEC